MKANNMKGLVPLGLAAILIFPLLFVACSTPSNYLPVVIPLRKDFRAVWNPNGEVIAYEHFQAGGDPERSGIYLVNVDGTDKRFLIYAGHQPDWHPSGEALVYMYIGDIFIYDLATEEKQQITFERGCAYPSFSSDGRFLAFSDNGFGERRSDIRIYDLEADSSYLLPSRPEGDIAQWLRCDWRPGSYEIVFERGWPNIWSLDYKGGSLKFVANGEYPRWSPGGDSLCYKRCVDRKDCGTFIYDLHSGTEKNIGVRDYASFSPDGTKIIYTTLEGRFNDPSSGRYILKVYDLVSKEERYLTR